MRWMSYSVVGHLQLLQVCSSLPSVKAGIHAIEARYVFCLILRMKRLSSAWNESHKVFGCCAAGLQTLHNVPATATREQFEESVAMLTTLWASFLADAPDHRCQQRKDRRPRKKSNSG